MTDKRTNEKTRNTNNDKGSFKVFARVDPTTGNITDDFLLIRDRI